MSWMESIASSPNRETAREKFEDWCEMQADVHDAIEFAGRQNDVALLHIETDGNHFARDLAQNYGTGHTPVRVKDVNALDFDRVEVEVLLAELRLPESDQ